MRSGALEMLVRIPLAQREAWENLGNRFSGDHAKFNWGDLWAMVGVLVVGAALVWLLRWLYGLQQARQLSNEPKHLFADLCRAHRLRKADRKRLQHLAEYHDLPSPAVLFVRPDLFAEPHLVDESEQSIAAFTRLEAKLFAGIERAEQKKPVAKGASGDRESVPVAPIANTTPIESTPAPH